MSKLISTRDGVIACTWGSPRSGNVVLPGIAFAGGGASARPSHGQYPSTSSRLQRRAGNQLRLLMMERCRSALGIVELHKPHDGALTHGKLLHRALEVVEIFHGFAVEAGDQAAPWNGRGSEDVTGVGDVDAGYRAVEMPCLLIRKFVEHALGVLDVFVRGDGMQVVHHEFLTQGLAAAFDLDFHHAADVFVQRRRQRHEFGRPVRR